MSVQDLGVVPLLLRVAVPGSVRSLGGTHGGVGYLELLVPLFDELVVGLEDAGVLEHEHVERLLCGLEVLDGLDGLPLCIIQVGISGDELASALLFVGHTASSMMSFGTRGFSLTLSMPKDSFTYR